MVVKFTPKVLVLVFLAMEQGACFSHFLLGLWLPHLLIQNWQGHHHRLYLHRHHHRHHLQQDVQVLEEEAEALAMVMVMVLVMEIHQAYQEEILLLLLPYQEAFLAQVL